MDMTTTIKNTFFSLKCTLLLIKTTINLQPFFTYPVKVVKFIDLERNIETVFFPLKTNLIL